MFNFVQEVVNKVVIQEIVYIGNVIFEFIKKRDFVIGEEVIKELLVYIEGVNLRVMQLYVDYINFNKFQINDIVQVFEFYGVEVVRVNIVRELLGVFDFYGIVVDKCYLSLIVDYMIRNGGFSFFNCIGLMGNVLFFIKMSYGMFFVVLFFFLWLDVNIVCDRNYCWFF